MTPREIGNVKSSPKMPEESFPFTYEWSLSKHTNADPSMKLALPTGCRALWPCLLMLSLSSDIQEVSLSSLRLKEDMHAFVGKQERRAAPLTCYHHVKEQHKQKKTLLQDLDDQVSNFNCIWCIPFRISMYFIHAQLLSGWLGQQAAAHLWPDVTLRSLHTAAVSLD